MSRRMFRIMLRHQRIDELIRREQRHRAPDVFKLMRLKKLKLKAKDMLRRMVTKPSRAG
ncbi:DUF465 domain-containing protein [Sphingomonas sp. HDW15A]|uniref:DUF465 domain-containing protein n=1 Tax=Sphingomonas sp. HDW15A TaxID=2714942 RepID=UPI00140849B4|nr:DUF465 domain-containing protein [Sphingomonas sp. HDW15A]QIK96732.1 DUF465 domain-containing protein [Sphingomonas sp. HDW15A]